MEKIVIQNTLHPLYATFKEIYTYSFPVFEQRTDLQQEKAFSHPGYHLAIYLTNNQFTGFIAYWEFPTYIYIEHFAIHPEFRGKGQGSRILERFISETGKIVLLEIDPITDEISEARFRFYQRCKFHRNDHLHTHPPYREGYKSHSLLILTTQRVISEEEYSMFSRDLAEIVMGKL